MISRGSGQNGTSRPSGWANGFYGVPLEALAPTSSSSPLIVVTTNDDSSQTTDTTKTHPHVIQSIFSPSHNNNNNNTNNTNNSNNNNNNSNSKSNNKNSKNSNSNSSNNNNHNMAVCTKNHYCRGMPPKTPPTVCNNKINSKNHDQTADPPPTEDIFYSPAQFTTASSLGTASPLTVWTKATAAKSSYRSLPNIQMLTQDFINNCSNRDQLQQIMDVLQSVGTCPSLLKEARDRMASITTTLAPQLPTKSGVQFDLQVEEEPKENEGDQTTATNHVFQTTQINQDTNASNQSSLVYSEDEDTVNSSPLQIDSTLCLEQSKAVTIPFSPSIEKERQLSQEVQRLTQTIVELEEAKQQEQKEYWDRLQKLSESRDAVQARLVALGKRLNSSQQAAHELVEKLKELREDNQTLSDQLATERACHEQYKRQANKQQVELTQKLKELSYELMKAQHEAAAANQHGMDNLKLNQLLRDTQKNLNDVTLERTVMLRAMLRAQGQEVITDIEKLPRKERRQMIADLAKKSTTSRYALDTMAGALKQSESKLKTETALRQTAESALGKINDEKRQIEKENFDLSQRVQILLKELESARAQVEKLLQSAHQQQQDDWGARETKLNDVIRGLRRQLRDQQPLARLYRDEVQRRRHLEEQVSMLKKKDRLESTGAKALPPTDEPRQEVAIEQAEKENCDLKAVPENAKPPAKETTTPKQKQVHFDSPPKSREKSPDSIVVSKQKEESQCPPKSIEKPRRFGSRKDLQEKYKKIRSPLGMIAQSK